MAVTVITDRRALEDVWRERTIASRERYRNAQQVAQMVRMERPHIPSPDGYLHYMQVLQKEHEALLQYRHVLEAFNELVLHFKIPPEENEESAITG